VNTNKVSAVNGVVKKLHGSDRLGNAGLAPGEDERSRQQRISNATATCACSHWARHRNTVARSDQLKLEKRRPRQREVNELRHQRPGVFAAATCAAAKPGRLAISEGRCAAKCVDEFLMGASDLPFLKLF